MLRQSPSRNQRAVSGFKVKHALQVFLLLVICTWVLYQVRHEKREDDNAVGDDSRDKGSEGERMNFGRKGLWLRPEMGNRESGSREDDEDEPGEGFEEMEVEGRGVGDDEIDGNDQETAEEADQLGEDFSDQEDKETAEKDQGEGEGEGEVVDGISQGWRKGNAASHASSQSSA